MTTGRHMDPGQMDPEFEKFRQKRLSTGKADPTRIEPNAKGAAEPAREPRQATPGALPRPTARSPGVIEPNAHAAAGAHVAIPTPGEGGTPAAGNGMFFGTAGFQQPKEEADPRRMKLSDLNLDVVKPPNDHVPVVESIKLIDIALGQAPGARPPARPAPTRPPVAGPRPAPPRPGATAPPGMAQPRPVARGPVGTPPPPRPPQARPPVAAGPRPQPPAPPQGGQARVPAADRVASQPGLTTPPGARAPRPPGPSVQRTASGRLVPVRPGDALPTSRSVPSSKKTTTRRLKGPRR